MASSDYERDFDALIQHLLPKVQESLRAADKEVDNIICRAFERAKRTDAAIRAANDGRTSLAVGSKRQDLAVLEPGYQEAIRTIFDPLAEAFWNEEIESFMMSLRRIRELLWKRPQPSVDYDWKGSVWRVEEEWQIRKGQHCDERGDETVRQVQLQEFVKKYKVTLTKVMNAAGVDRADFYRWRHKLPGQRGHMLTSSKPAQRIKDVLSQKTPIE